MNKNKGPLKFVQKNLILLLMINKTQQANRKTIPISLKKKSITETLLGTSLYYNIIIQKENSFKKKKVKFFLLKLDISSLYIFIRIIIFVMIYGFLHFNTKHYQTPVVLATIVSYNR